MRPILFAVAGLSALLLTGCSADQPETASAPATAPSAAAGTSAAAEGGTAPSAATAAPDGPDAAAGDAALSEDTDAICEQASRTSTAFGKTFSEDYRLLTEAAAQGGQAETEAKQKAARDVENFSHALLDLSRLASDPQVKKALGAMGAEVTALKGDLAKIDDKKLAGLHATLDKACGRG
ncbi:hypothetical protein [Actinoplanes aureus]|uniref:Small secreted protein n=1 Tax=Actinoplanes aureus TaxID=2792083 RepID=A0A931CJZ9_9ACTN|nr:hypothetical protein [Actinoplanes aureus]MBG0568763.1 hypothetical protein [Actinoplanes aureus]